MTDQPRYGKPEQYVTIYCAAQSHRDQPWIIGTWTPGMTDDGLTYWRNSPDQWMRGMFVRSASPRHETNRAVGRTAYGDEVLDLDTVEGRERRYEVERDGKVFGSERLVCQLCGDRIKRTEDNLQADLFRLAGAGILDMTLTGYREFTRMR